MPDYLLVIDEDPVNLQGAIDAAGALQFCHPSGCLADYSQTLDIEHRDLDDSSGLVMIRIFDFVSDGATWQMSVAHGATHWSRGTHYAYYEFGPMYQPLEIDATATSDGSLSQQKTRKLWIKKATPPDGQCDRPDGYRSMSAPLMNRGDSTRTWESREEPTPYDPERVYDDIASLDSETLFGLIEVSTANLDRRYEAALELASRPGDQPRLCNYTIDTLTRTPPDSPWHQLCVRLAEEIRIDDSSKRRLLADALFVSAKALDEIGASEVVWTAIRRWASLVPASELGELSTFLDPTNEGETIQCTLDSLWHTLSVCEHPGAVLTPLANRAHELARKGLDPDWQIVPLASSISVCAALAFCVLALDIESLRTFCQDMRAAQHFPLDLFKADFDSALQHAEARQALALPRLQLLHAILFSSSSSK